MDASPRVRVYMACSFDGYIAGPDHALDWLHQNYAAEGDLEADDAALGFEAFMSQVGCMLMGRTTYDVVEAIGQWPYGSTPVLVTTRRPLQPVAETVEAVEGSIESLIARAKAVANTKDVYLDGGDLIRQALEADLVDEITATFIPILLTGGTRLFDGLTSRRLLQFVSHHALGGGMLQVTARVRRGIHPPSTA